MELQKSLTLCAVAVLGLATAAQAATIVSSVDNSSSKIAFDNTYPLVGAAMFAMSGQSPPVVAATYDGIAFSLYPENNGTNQFTMAGGVYAQVTDGREFAYRTNVNGADQYRIMATNDSNMPVRLRFYGLDPNETYQFQFGYYKSSAMYNQNAWLAPEADGLPDYGHLGNAQAQYLDYGTAGHEYALLTATVSGTDEFSLQMERGNQSMNAFSVHQVPEPATLALLGLGGLGMLIGRRRK